MYTWTLSPQGREGRKVSQGHTNIVHPKRIEDPLRNPACTCCAPAVKSWEAMTKEQKDRLTMIEKQCAKKVNLFQDNTNDRLGDEEVEVAG